MAVENGDLVPVSSDKVDWWDSGSYPTGDSERTCSVWIKAPKVPDNGDTNGAYIWTFGNHDGLAQSGTRFSIRVQHSGESQPGVLRNEILGSFVYGTTDICDDQWHHICVTWDGTSSFPGNTRLFVDGTEETSRTEGSSITPNTAGSTHHITVGGYNADPNGASGPIGWLGEVAEYSVWNKELSESEIQSLALGISPISIPNNLMFYVNYIRDKKEAFGTELLTNGNNTVTNHPRILYA